MDNNFEIYIDGKLKSIEAFGSQFKAEDGVIESIYSINFRMEGWMWHPERYKKFKSFDIKSFKRLFR